MYISHFNDTTTASIRSLYDARLDLHIHIYSYIIHVVLGYAGLQVVHVPEPREKNIAERRLIIRIIN